MTRRATFTLTLLFMLASPTLALAEAAQIGHVAGLDGHAHAALPGEAPRLLDCGDPIYEGERVTTEAGTHLVVATSPGPEVHLSPDSLMVLRRAADGELSSVVTRGALRLLDLRSDPGHRISTPSGFQRLLASDVEIVRGDDGAVKVCEWSKSGLGQCRRIAATGQSSWVQSGAPGLDPAMQDVCEWKREIHALYRASDFTSLPPVAAGASRTPFDPEIEIEPPCAGDECGPGTPMPPMVFDPPVEPRVLTVAPPPIAIPPFPIP